MSSYLSSLLTSTSSSISTLRRTLASEPTDGDTDDDSAITRVLRAYYTDSPSRPWPTWLPPDPKRPPPSHNQSYNSSVGQGYGGFQQQQQYQQPGGGGQQRNALADLWDAPAQQPPPQQRAPASLRTAPAGARQQVPMQQHQQQQHLQPAARPLPSQRQGSYQSAFQNQVRGGRGGGQEEMLVAQNTGGSSGSGTAQERLKARLWGQGGRAGSPSGGGPHQQQGYGREGWR